jgi:class 3 adenylate cyclase
VKDFYALVDEIADLPEPERQGAERRLRERFEVERAVLVLDMSEFSLSVRRSGIVAHLCLIRRVQRLAAPIVAAHGGEVLKCEADNVFAVFPEPRGAVQAALAINRALAGAAQPGAAGSPPAVGIGIDFGRVLLIPGRDAFGDAVNIAHKLGEDVARGGEILVSEATRDRLGECPAEPLSLSVSGLHLKAWRIAGGG